MSPEGQEADMRRLPQGDVEPGQGHLHVLLVPQGDPEVNPHFERNRGPECEAQAGDPETDPRQQRRQRHGRGGEHLQELRQVGRAPGQERTDGDGPGRAEEDGIRNLSRGGISSCLWTGRREIRQEASIYCLHKQLTTLNDSLSDQ